MSRRDQIVLVLLFLLHAGGNIGLILIWSDQPVPDLGAPGLFGLIVGLAYAAGGMGALLKVAMIRGAR